MEIQATPGIEQTVAFEITAAATPVPERGRIMVSATVGPVLEDGSAHCSGNQDLRLNRHLPGSDFSPAAFTVNPAQTQLVRITVKVPEKTPPGVYRTGLFVQERPSATPPAADLRVINVRVRYVFLLYVMVGPISSRPELVNLEADNGNGPLRLICEMRATPAAVTPRPLVFWSIRHDGVAEADARGKVESTVLLPAATLREAYSLEYLKLAPGRYQASVFVDFQDGQPQQSMSRDFDVPEPRSPRLQSLLWGS